MQQDYRFALQLGLGRLEHPWETAQIANNSGTAYESLETAGNMNQECSFACIF